jgi:hypothetical protein
MSKITLHIFIIATFSLLLVGCYQGRPSKDEPIHLNPNMDKQPKYRPQAESNFFEDGSTMRTPVEGTVARGELKEDSRYYYGKDDNGEYIKVLPIDIDMSLLLRGQNRFNIYCSPCHSRVGDGRGIVVENGMVPPTSYHLDRLREAPDGQIFDVITNGLRNMPPYKYQVSVEDRWAIVAYFRALQRSQNATIDDIPEDMKDKIQ